MELLPNKRSFLLIAAVWAGLLPFFAIWLYQDQVVAPWDMSVHARLAYDLWHELIRGHLPAFYKNSNYYPPLFHLAAAPLSIFGGHPDLYCLVNWLFLLLTMWAVWLIGREIAGEAAGLVAAVLVPACVLIAWMCVQPMTDLCLTALVCWTLWILIRTPDLEGRQPHALGILIGLGMLGKWTYAFFTALPIFIYIFQYYRSAPFDRFIRKMLIVAGWAVAIAAPWYIHSLPHMFAKIGPQLSGAVASTEGDPTVLSMKSLAQYWIYFEHLYFRLPLACLVVVGILITMIRFRRDLIKNSKWLMAWSSVASGVCILTLVANKDPRYIMPAVPPIIVIAAASLSAIAKPYRKLIVIAAVLLTFCMTGWNLFYFHPPLRKSTQVEEIADWLIEQRAEGKHVRAAVVPNEWRLNSEALNYALHRRDRKSGSSRLREPSSIEKYDFVITLSPPNQNTGISPNEIENTAFIHGLPGWGVTRTFERFDGKKIEVWRKVRN